MISSSDPRRDEEALMTGTVASQAYKRPPITEAVIGIQFAAPVADDNLRRVSARFKALYPGEQEVKSLVGVHVVTQPGSKPPLASAQETTGHRRASDDATEILLFLPDQLIVSQLAPYPGWETFFPRFMRDWTLWKREVGYLKLNRLGVRYINRIDLPVTQDYIEQEEYVNIYVQLPQILGPTASYSAQAVLPLKDTNSQLVINTGVVPSPLLNHVSILVDIDIGRIQDVPQRDEELFELLPRLRDAKNMVFETCITDRARELFSQ
jgi:uncharacterized protein (TIGR04255 family)